MGEMTSILEDIKNKMLLIRTDMRQLAAKISEIENSATRSQNKDILERIKGVNVKINEILALCQTIEGEAETGKQTGKTIKHIMEDRI